MNTIIKYNSTGMKTLEYTIDDLQQIQGLYTLYYDNGLVKEVSYYINNSKKFVIQRYHSNGHLAYETELDLRLKGLTDERSYNAYGFMTSQIITVGDDSGDTIHYDYCGTKSQIVTGETRYTCNMKTTGLHVARYNSGRIKDEQYYENSYITGKATTYYDLVKFDSDGTPTNEQIVYNVTHYAHGAIHGEYLEYYKSGIIAKHFNYVSNRKVGLQREYHINGTLKSEIIFNNGQMQIDYDKTYNDNGILRLHRIFLEPGKVIEELSYNADGSMKEHVVWEYRNNIRYIKETKRYTDSVLVYHIIYDNSDPRRTSYTEYGFNAATGFRTSITELKHTENEKVALKFKYSEDGKPRRISLIVNGEYQTTDFKKLLKKKTSEIDDSDIAYIKLAYF